MIRAAVTFFAIGLLAIVLGAYNVAGVSIEMGRILLFVFLIIAALSFLVSLTTGRSSKKLL